MGKNPSSKIKNPGFFWKNRNPKRRGWSFEVPKIYVWSCDCCVFCFGDDVFYSAYDILRFGDPVQGSGNGDSWHDLCVIPSTIHHPNNRDPGIGNRGVLIFFFYWFIIIE